MNIEQIHPIQEERPDNTPKILAVSTMFMIFLVFVVLMFVPVNDKNEHLITQLVTAMIGAWGLATGFYLNTNKNAAKAQDTMNVQAKNAATALLSSPPPAVKDGEGK